MSKTKPKERVLIVAEENGIMNYAFGNKKLNGKGYEES